MGGGGTRVGSQRQGCARRSEGTVWPYYPLLDLWTRIFYYYMFLWRKRRAGQVLWKLECDSTAIAAVP